MAPNSISDAGPSTSTSCIGKANAIDAHKRLNEGQEEPYKIEIKWRNTIVLTLLHIASVYCFFDLPKYGLTYLLQFLMLLFTAFGVTAGSHRYFTHKSYKANLPLKLILILLQTLSAQEDILKWVRDHRVHHKFTDTDADPHNSKRGFFFSHMGWLLCKKHPDVKKYGSKVDMSDLESDKILLYHRVIYMPASIILSFLLPVWVSHYFWGEDYITSMNFNILRYVFSLHINWSINSFTHMFGSRPYDVHNSSTDSYLFGFLAFGEGWHNYHHAFPWDYKTSELGNYWFNFSLIFIDFFAMLGWATDLKTVPDHVIRARVLRTGDGTHPHSIEAVKKNFVLSDNNNKGEERRDLDHFWGLEDSDVLEEDKVIEILKKKEN